jgi:hypothetical protein
MIVFSFNCSFIRFYLSQEQVERGPAFGFLAKCLVTGFLVSGDGRDRIVWISRLTFIRQLTGHNAPLAAIDINDLTGDIASPCSGTLLHLWSINSDSLLASVHTLGRPDRPLAAGS